MNAPIVAGFKRPLTMGLPHPGRTSSATGSKNCLDFTMDGCITMDDLLAWEASGPTSACPWGSGAPPEEALSSDMNVSGISAHSFNYKANAPSPVTTSSLIVLAKSQGYTLKGGSYLFDVPLDGTLDGTATRPRGISGTGHLAGDASGNICEVNPSGNVYGIDPNNGSIVRLILPEGGSQKDMLLGTPKARLNDMAFHPTEAGIVYVAPMWVGPEQGGYKVSAKLQFSSNGTWKVLQCYEIPMNERSHKASDPNTTEDLKDNPEKRHPCEIEIDATGKYVFVLSRCSTNQDNWLLVYDESNGIQPIAELPLSDPTDGWPDVEGPSCMLLSESGDQLYLTSSVRDPNGPADDDLKVSVYIYSVTLNDMQKPLSYLSKIVVEFPGPQSSNPDWEQWSIPGRFVSMVTSMTEDPGTGCLYAVGYVAPRFDEKAIWSSKVWDNPFDRYGLFTVPMLARIDPGTGVVKVDEIKGIANQIQLGLPLSAVWTCTKPPTSQAGGLPSSQSNLPAMVALAQNWLRLDCEKAPW